MERTLKLLAKLDAVAVRLLVRLSDIMEMLLPPILFVVKLLLLLVFNRYTMSWMAVIAFYVFVYLGYCVSINLPKGEHCAPPLIQKRGF